ncbi:hypothetical protein ACPXCG_16690 [Gordonia sp. DT218]|uniref:hypothetical protein n=1 Tax=unclassified Gordonia (in: high G+C Gram-positive bacteria) TaxID=2657482 RepID=UPI003CEC38DF
MTRHHAIAVCARTELRGLISQHHRLATICVDAPGQRRVHRAVAILLNDADPQNWGDTSNVTEPDIRDLIVDVITRKIAATSDPQIRGHLIGSRMLLTNDIAPTLVIDSAG